MSRPQTHSHLTPQGRAVWLTEQLWRAAKGLPTVRVRVDAFPELDMDCWFGERHAPTIREIAKHARKIRDTDLAYPVILAADGRLMDGGHRLAKALLLGLEEVEAVRFGVDPEPDHILPA